MKKPHVLNRPMFNKGGTSAYGRGIASNLVTEEQRIRYNTGGRVGLWGGAALGTAGKILPWATKMWSRLKPTSKFRIPKTAEGVLPGKYKAAPYSLGEIAKSPSLMWKGIKENPWWAGAGGVGLTSDPVAAVTKGVAKAIPAAAKWGAEALTPGRFEKHLPWVKEEGDKNKEVPGKTNKLDAILAAADAENKAKAEKAEKAAKEAEGAAAEGAEKDPNVIDLTESERAGLKATLYAGAGAGALDPSNKTVADVLRNTLLGASKAGQKIYDPTTERKYRKYAEAHKNIQEEAFKRKTEWETSDEKLMTDMAATLGKQGAKEMMAFNKQVPKTGSGAEYKTIKKSVTKSKKKGAPLAGLLVFDTDIQKYMVWDAQLKEYRHVPGDIDEVQKVLTELRE
jgi:hypothetical protein